MGILLLGASPTVGTVLFHGQSNMNGFVGTAAGTPAAALAGTSYFDDVGLTWGAVPNANGVRNLLNALVTATGRSWRGINGSVNGASIEYLMDPSPSAGFGLFTTKLALAGVTSADLIFWLQGEGNTNTSPHTQERDYITNIGILHQSFATLMGRTKSQIPFIIGSLATYVGGVSGTVLTDVTWSTIQGALFNASLQLPDVHFSHSNLDATMNPDHLHQDGFAHDKGGLRFGKTAKSVLGLGGGEAHFEIASATTIDLRTTRVTINHSSGATDWSGSSGFEVSGDNGATYSAATVSRVDASRFDLVTAADKSSTNTRMVRYQFGTSPDMSSPILDNSTLALPLVYTRQDINPVSLSTVPRPDYWGNAYDDNQTGTTQANAGIPIGPAVARRLVIVGLCGPTVALSSVTITPNIGTAKSATIISKPSNARAALVYALLDADADTATTVTVSVTYASTPFSRTQMDVWAIASGGLSSTTPVGTQVALVLSNTVGSLNIATSAAGFVIAVASDSTFSQTGVMSGAETYAQRRFISTIPCMAADSSNNSASGSSAVTATYPSSGDISIAAVSFR